MATRYWISVRFPNEICGTRFIKIVFFYYPFNTKQINRERFSLSQSTMLLLFAHLFFNLGLSVQSSKSWDASVIRAFVSSSFFMVWRYMNLFPSFWNIFSVDVSAGYCRGKVLVPFIYSFWSVWSTLFNTLYTLQPHFRIHFYFTSWTLSQLSTSSYSGRSRVPLV